MARNRKTGGARKKASTSRARREEQERVATAAETSGPAVSPVSATIDTKAGDSAEISPSGEPVPVAAQEAAAEATDDSPTEAELAIHDAAPLELAEAEKIGEADASEQAEPLAELALSPTRPGEHLQDLAFFENARRDEAVAQGVELTTQEALWQLARQEEMQTMGVPKADPPDPDEPLSPDVLTDTASELRRQARAEEIRAEKREEALFGSPDAAAAARSMHPTEGREDLGENVPKAPETPEESEAVRA